MQKFIQHDVRYHSYRSVFNGRETIITARGIDMVHDVIMDVIKNEHYKITGYFKNSQLGNIIVLESQDISIFDGTNEIEVDALEKAHALIHTAYTEYLSKKIEYGEYLSKNPDEKEEYATPEIKTVVQTSIPSIKIISNTSPLRRLWNFLKNPFTYVFNGTIEY